MDLSTIQTELVACALCKADGNDPDENVPSGTLETVQIGRGRIVQRQATIKGWQRYESEARKFIVASAAMEKWWSTLHMFRSAATFEEQSGTA